MQEVAGLHQVVQVQGPATTEPLAVTRMEVLVVIPPKHQAPLVRSTQEMGKNFKGCVAPEVYACVPAPAQLKAWAWGQHATYVMQRRGAYTAQPPGPGVYWQTHVQQVGFMHLGTIILTKYFKSYAAYSALYNYTTRPKSALVVQNTPRLPDIVQEALSY